MGRVRALGRPAILLRKEPGKGVDGLAFGVSPSGFGFRVIDSKHCSEDQRYKVQLAFYSQTVSFGATVN